MYTTSSFSEQRMFEKRMRGYRSMGYRTTGFERGDGGATSTSLSTIRARSKTTPSWRSEGLHLSPSLRRLEHLGEPYYVALLSAAAYHGAAHQKPQVFQVMIPKARRALECGGVRVVFVARRNMASTSVVERNTPTRIIRIASPAATALEVVGYPEHCGYLDNIATVLAELAESIDGDALEGEARRAPVAWVQRLGYLLVLVEQNALADRLDGVLEQRKVFTVPLAPWKEMEGMPRDSRWNVAINTDVEPDL